ncbi:MAG: family peptidase [Frankiales bacterium]|nr:family peptidase [Frankiales bacterium]
MSVRFRAVAAAAALSAGVALALPAQASSPRIAPVSSYIVTLSPGSSAPAVARLAGRLGKVGFVYSNALNGFSIRIPTALAPALRALPGAVAVQRSQQVRAFGAQRQPLPPSYGLDRIDPRALPLTGTFNTTADGSGVTAYVIDSGILYSHRDFGGRAVKGFDAITPGGSAVDCYGHGTHVAGTLGGTTYGVAKKVRLVGVRVLDCDGNGTSESVVAGLDWVVGNHKPGVRAVANLSLGGGTDDAIDAAVNRALADGITVGVAAGNDGGLLNDLLGGSNACNHSPARVPGALTVAATDDSDRVASYSNKGSCVDLFAPGTDIVSDYDTDSTATETMSGTSMSTPHVMGVAALYLSAVGYRSPDQVSAQIVNTATQGAVQNVSSGTANRLLFTR